MHIARTDVFHVPRTPGLSPNPPTWAGASAEKLVRHDDRRTPYKPSQAPTPADGRMLN